MCASCTGGGGVSHSQQRAYQPPQQTNFNCAYTYDQISIWRDKIKCVKDRDLLDVVGTNLATINSYLGILLSALNWGQICYFEKYYANIGSLIQVIAQKTDC